MEKMAWDGPKWGRKMFVPTHPDPVNILCTNDVGLDNCHSCVFWIRNVCNSLSTFLDFDISKRGLEWGQADRLVFPE